MKKQVKFIIIFLSAFLIRLIPFRAPNVEPIMAAIMPLGKKYGGAMAFSFGFLSIVLFDAITSGLGIWTAISALAYGLLGLGAQYYFKNKKGWKNYAIYAIMATIVYDAVTGLTIGPLFFHQSFMISLIGQIPFTILHLLSNVSFAIVLSPVIEKWLVAASANATTSQRKSKIVLVSCILKIKNDYVWKWGLIPPLCRNGKVST